MKRLESGWKIAWLFLLVALAAGCAMTPGGMGGDHGGMTGGGGHQH